MYQDTIEIVLDNPISYLKDGVKAESTLLMCSAPAAKHRKHTMALRQKLTHVIMDMSKNFNNAGSQETPQQKEDDQSKLDGATVIFMLYSGDADFFKFQEDFKAFICGTGYSELVKIDGEVPLTSTQYDNLLDEDLEILIGGYIENFLLSSMMKGNLAS